MEYDIFASLYEESNSGWVWLPKQCGVRSRTVVKIRCPGTGKRIWCEARVIEPNFLSRYNHPPRRTILPEAKVLVINDWYRRRLGCLSTGSQIDLVVENAHHPWGWLRAGIGHPDHIVRLATWLGAISVSLGLVSLFIAFPWPLGNWAALFSGSMAANHPLERLAWAATVLGLSLAGLAYLYTKARDVKWLIVRRNGLLRAIETELKFIEPWVTSWSDDYISKPPAQWQTPFYTVFPFQYDAILEGALRGPELQFGEALDESLTALKLRAHTCRYFSDLHRQFVYGNASLATAITRKQEEDLDAEGNVTAVRFFAQLDPEEGAFYRRHLRLHEQLTRRGLAHLEKAIAEVRKGIAREQERHFPYLGRARYLFWALLFLVGLVGLIGTLIYLFAVMCHAIPFAATLLDQAIGFGRSLLRR